MRVCLCVYVWVSVCLSFIYLSVHKLLVFSELKKGRQKVQFGTSPADVAANDVEDGTWATCQLSPSKQV